VDCGFEVDFGRWADWACTMPVLVVYTLAVSGRQLGVNSSLAHQLTYRICIGSR
jgi:hypothetical protein